MKMARGVLFIFIFISFLALPVAARPGKMSKPAPSVHAPAVAPSAGKPASPRLPVIVPLGSAGRPQQDSQAATRSPQQTPAPSSGTAGYTPAPVKVYEYNSQGRRDPFAPLVAAAEVEKKKQKRSAAIENYEVSDFKLVAVLWTAGGYYAVITLPDGKSYTVREGSKLGLHSGTVYKVTKENIIIREQLRDYKNTLITKDTTLKLRGKEDDDENGGKKN